LEKEYKMMKRGVAAGLACLCLLVFTGLCAAEDQKIAGVTFPGEKVVSGKTLKLNGVALRKKFGFVKVFAGGFYLENPSSDPNTIINIRGELFKVIEPTNGRLLTFKEGKFVNMIKYNIKLVKSKMTRIFWE
jgi:hypothetical protein